MSTLIPPTGSSLQTALVDTSVLIVALRQHVPTLQQLAAIQVVVSSTVLGELLYGAHNSSRVGAELTAITLLLSSSVVVAADDRTADSYAQAKLALRRQGTPIPENDIWIAAAALQYGLPLITADAHFEKVPGLVVERW